MNVKMICRGFILLAGAGRSSFLCVDCGSLPLRDPFRTSSSAISDSEVLG
jgi:hypothetical protein